MLLTDNGCLKIADFGLARPLAEIPALSNDDLNPISAAMTPGVVTLW
jgi:serine/threonine protein kinase